MWILNDGAVIEEISDEYVGFVYLITNIQTGRMYVGKKLAKFKTTKIKNVTLKSGLKKKKKVTEYKDSDWKTYYGSSKELLEDVSNLGSENFRREIIHFCKTKGTLSYMEAREQFDRRVLENGDKFYNGQIMCRVNATHLKF